MSAAVTVTTATEPAAVITSATAQLGAGSATVNFSTMHTAKLLIALDDAVLGFLDPSLHSAFTLTDIETGSVLTLVPYNAAGQRGTSVTLKLGDAKSSTDSLSPDPAASDHPTTSPSLTPKAPNAGAPPRHTNL